MANHLQFIIAPFWLLLLHSCLCLPLHRNFGKWTKLNQKEVCIGAKRDGYATLTYLKKYDSFLTAVKFVHRHGQVRCQNPTIYNSNWGCHHRIHDNLNIFLTDWKNKIIMPDEHQTTVLNGGWYALPGFNAISPILVLSNFANPFYLYQTQRMRIWYGEDLFEHSEDDNFGKVCMDVYGYLI